MTEPTTEEIQGRIKIHEDAINELSAPPVLTETVDTPKTRRELREDRKQSK
jgi:hypothetical protein